MKEAPMLKPVFIVGQYKCGTTWLLNALAAHPQVLGVAEVDLVRAVYNFAKNECVGPATREERLYRFFDGSGWCAFHDGRSWRGRDVIERMEQGRTPEVIPGDAGQPLRFLNLPAATQRLLYDRIREADDPQLALNSFLSVISSEESTASHLVMKAADQVPIIEWLESWRPDARKIVITRDGRDAAISAEHFIELTHAVDAPYKDVRLRYIDLLGNWADRAAAVVRLAEEKRVYVLRYEDLMFDFAGTLSRLLVWLDLDADREGIRSIQRQTSFEAVTGRRRGVEAKHFFRKGIAGEWRDRLDLGDRVRAWAVAGEQLEALGYTWNGWLRELALPVPEASRRSRKRSSSSERPPTPGELAEELLPPDGPAVVISATGRRPDLGERATLTIPVTTAKGRKPAEPDSSAEVIGMLHAARGEGAAYLIVPRAELWWLDAYPAFRAYLEEAALRLVGHDGIGAVYHLGTRPRERSPAHYARVDSTGTLEFQCNVCGEQSRVRLADLQREIPSCGSCRSTPRLRAIISALSRELFGTSMPIHEFPVRRDLTGIGLSDWGGYASRLAEKLSYTNTFFHTEPMLDITGVDRDLEGAYDFVISSEVFEHVVPPVSTAFENLLRLLRPGGVTVFTVPYGLGDTTVEHYPDLHSYEVVEDDGRPVVRNVTRDGRVEVFADPVFHGGPGETLELRQFCESDLVQHFRSAGFSSVEILSEPDLDYGVFWPEPYSHVIVARAPGSSSAVPAATEARGSAEERSVSRPDLTRVQDDGPDSEERRRDVAKIVAASLRQSLASGSYRELFGACQEAGAHVVPVHFYFPIPDTRTLDDAFWDSISELPGISIDDQRQVALLRRLGAHADEFEKRLSKKRSDEALAVYRGEMFGGTDARVLYCMVRELQPAHIVEVGSGESTWIASAAADAQTEIVTIDPFPSDEFRSRPPPRTSLVEKPVQEVDLSTFERLGADDILFIDSSHVVAVGSDVVHLFLEVMPRLRPGVVVHVHDIYFPRPYRRDWVMDKLRFWSEQHLLQAFLAFNSDFEVLLCNSMLAERNPDVMREVFPQSPWWGGGSLWMRRKET
jgi:predicted O-methyltransferase YrrM